MYLSDIFLKTLQFTLRDVSDECFIVWVRSEFWYYTFSLNNKPAVYRPAGNLLSLKWQPYRDELLSTVYRRNGYLETLSDCANTFSTSASKNTCQNVLTDEK